MAVAIYLAHLNPVTNAHIEIIEYLKKQGDVKVMPVIFLKDGTEVNSRSFPFNFETRKKMLNSVFGDSIEVSTNYTFYAPFLKYFPPLLSPYSWQLRSQILQGINGDFFTYTGDKVEGLMLRLYGLRPKVGTRKDVSASSVKNKMYAAAQGRETDWKNDVPKEVIPIIEENWEVVKEFASSPDMTTRIAGMKFPKEGLKTS